mmetsp:Transcript_22405/g.72726  ORF Transcript_22405/g.72726 Transcript_22405/m.72726 type:complete len:227 (-) Transcript_22405:1153-1833(-)
MWIFFLKREHYYATLIWRFHTSKHRHPLWHLKLPQNFSSLHRVRGSHLCQQVQALLGRFPIENLEAHLLVHTLQEHFGVRHVGSDHHAKHSNPILLVLDRHDGGAALGGIHLSEHSRQRSGMLPCERQESRTALFPRHLSNLGNRNLLRNDDELLRLLHPALFHRALNLEALRSLAIFLPLAFVLNLGEDPLARAFVHSAENPCAHREFQIPHDDGRRLGRPIDDP